MVSGSVSVSFSVSVSVSVSGGTVSVSVSVSGGVVSVSVSIGSVSISSVSTGSVSTGVREITGYAAGSTGTYCPASSTVTNPASASAIFTPSVTALELMVAPAMPSTFSPTANTPDFSWNCARKSAAPALEPTPEVSLISTICTPRTVPSVFTPTIIWIAPP